MTILIDNGHGRETPGKRSPDGQLLEWQWTRHVAARLYEKLTARGLSAARLVTEDKDIALRERVRRANAYGSDALVVSIHVNAAGMGAEWLNARGWSAHVAPNASNKSKLLATIMAKTTAEMGLKVRQPLPHQTYWVQNLAICRDTKAPAVLTENLFMDNREDCAWLLSPAGQEVIADLHFRAIINFLMNNEL